MMDYKNTVFLPQTSFSMKAGLSTKEPEILEYWESINLYGQLQKNQEQFDRPYFNLYDGPPYANGNIHIGHAFNKILKDIVAKSFRMSGYHVPFVPVWDCHGLPIEWKIEESYRNKGKNKDDVPILEFREECRQFAKKWIDVQKKEFQRLGVLADWQNFLATMDFRIEAKIAEQFIKFILNGDVYRGFKPVMWSVVEKTALAEAEVEYKDRVSDSIYVRFSIIQSQLTDLDNTCALIWTTTPWTLPANRAIAFGPDFDYAVVRVQTTQNPLIREGEKFLIAKDLIESITQTLQISAYDIVKQIKGEELANTICAHPWRGQGYEFDVPMLAANHVTTDAGTGLVHTAPSHGVDDFYLGKQHNLEVPAVVGDDGVYYDHVPLFHGQHIFKINPVILDTLKAVGALAFNSKIEHSYPHSWRSKAPLIFRTAPQWFISMDHSNLRQKALKAIDQVEWFPAQGRNRIQSMVQDRPDWCVSRQRAWGTPLPVFVHVETGAILRDEQVYKRVVEAIAAQGGDAWYTTPCQAFLGDSYKADEYEQCFDVLDVWFDSGATHAFALESINIGKIHPDLHWPADLYLEGSDQHRGWFQSSLMASCGVYEQSPFKRVLTHGFVLDENGYKMSKSQGNVVAPETVWNTLGAELLRLWTVCVDYSDDVRIGMDNLKHQEDIYRKLRNTIRYLLGAVKGFTHNERVDISQMPALERWVLHRIGQLEQLRLKSLKTFDFLTFYNNLHHFCAVDLSSFYFDIRKDRLYCDAFDDINRRATRTVMHDVLEILLHWLAPVLSFTTEDAWLCYGSGDTWAMKSQNKQSIHLNQAPSVDERWLDDSLGQEWEMIKQIRKVLTGALEIKRASKEIGSSLQGTIDLYVNSTDSKVLEIVKSVDWAELAISSQVNIRFESAPDEAYQLQDLNNIGALVSIADGQKCSRCWKVTTDIIPEKSICKRCNDVVERQANNG